jgi:CRP-like cAMP-binding protein
MGNGGSAREDPMSRSTDLADSTRPGENRLLAGLPAASLAALRPDLAVVSCRIKDVVYRPNEPISHVIFPLTGVFSLLSLGDEEGEMIEVATIGNEGFVGLPVFLGADSTPGLAIAQVPGEALRMTAEAFREAVARDAAFAAVLNRSTLALFTQIAQSSFCNRTHPMGQRCARWLLMTQDRVDAPEFPLTHEFLAQMLGVRRATVTEAMGPLQEAGLIEYARGIVGVVDRDGLEAVACECYRIIRDEYRRLTGA